MKKITIKHYLNKTVKPIFNGKSNTYPLYVQIIADRVNYKMKSNFEYFDGYIDDVDFNSEFIQNYIKSENDEITKVVSYLIQHDRKDFLNANGFRKLAANLWSELNDNFYKLFTEEGESLNQGVLPNAFYNVSFYDIDEILTFTKSDIDTYFSEEYLYSKIGMEALKYSVLTSDHKDLDIIKLTVFDFLFSEDGRSRVLESVMRYHGFHGVNEEDEYNKVLKGLEIILFKD